MSISILIYSKNNKYLHEIDIPLGSYTSLLSQLNPLISKLNIFSNLIDNADSEEEFIIRDNDILLFLEEVELIIFNKNNIISNDLYLSLNKLIAFFQNENINDWLITSF